MIEHKSLRAFFLLSAAGLAIGCASHHYAAPPPDAAPEAAPAPAAPPAPYIPPPSANPASAPAPQASSSPDVEAAPSAQSAPAPAAPVSAAASEVLKLRAAGYSEDFLLNKVRHDNVNYELSTDDLVALRQAGLSETLIEAMTHSGGRTADAAQSAAPLARHAQFDGLVRQKRSFLGVGGSKNKLIGKLVVDGERVNWYQSADADDSFSLFQKNVKEMWLNCAPRAGENLCLEICFKTYAGDEWCFRDAGWENGDNRQVLAVFDYFQKAFPATFYSKREKKSF